jgi:Pyridoxamine 5'-phosphate oxidase
MPAPGGDGFHRALRDNHSHGDAAQDLLTDRRGHGPTVDSHDHRWRRRCTSGQGMATMAKGGPELLQDPVAQGLLASRIPARLAYTWTDGTPRVVSIWFHWDGTDLVMGTLPGAPKLKALHTGDRVAITIDTNDPPHHVLSIRGTAEVTQTEGVVPEYAQAAVRYLGKEQGEAYVGSLPPAIRMGRIAVRPDQVVVLDFQTRFPTAVSSLGSA